MATFPSALQQIWNRDGFQLSDEDVRQLTSFETGPVKSRLISTRPRVFVTASIWISTSEYETLDLFFSSTLNHGTKRFDHPHPISFVSYSWLFGPGGIIYRPIGGDLFNASFTLTSK